MTTPRLYLPEEMEVGSRLRLGADDRRYIGNVLRLRVGDRLILFDGSGKECDALIRELDAASAAVEIMGKRDVAPAGVSVTLAQALPKGSKMDIIVQKTTELGVNRIIPFHSLRSIPRIPAEKSRLKTARWQKIAVEACRQCGRADIPEVTDVLSFEEAIEAGGIGALKLLLWEEERERRVRDVLKDENVGQAEDIVVIVGPEGGFAPSEVDRASKLQYLSVGLGRRILKVETASIAILTIIQYERGQLG